MDTSMCLCTHHTGSYYVSRFWARCSNSGPYLSVLATWCRSWGIQPIAYLDNWLIYASGRERLSQQMGVLIDAAEKLGTEPGSDPEIDIQLLVHEDRHCTGHRETSRQAGGRHAPPGQAREAPPQSFSRSHTDNTTGRAYLLKQGGTVSAMLNRNTTAIWEELSIAYYY